MGYCNLLHEESQPATLDLEGENQHPGKRNTGTPSGCEVQEQKPQVRSSSIILEPCGGTSLSLQAADSTPCSSCSGHSGQFCFHRNLFHITVTLSTPQLPSQSLFSPLSCFSFHVLVPLTRVQTTHHFSNIIL